MRRALRRNVTGLVAPRPEAGGVGVSVGVGAAFRPITESTCRLTAASASLIGSRWSRGDGATAVFPKPSISSSVVPTALPGLSRPLARPSNSSRALVVRALAARGDLSGGLPASYAVALLARELRHERRPKGEEAALLASSRALAQTPPLDLVCGSSMSEDAALAFEPRDERRPAEKRAETCDKIPARREPFLRGELAAGDRAR